MTNHQYNHYSSQNNEHTMNMEKMAILEYQKTPTIQKTIEEMKKI